MKTGRSGYFYATKEEFMAILAKGGFVPITYKSCNTNGFQEYFINEECDIISIKTNNKDDRIKYSYYKYNPNTSKIKNNKGYHSVNIGFSALLHRVVAATFLGQPRIDQTDVHHKNGNVDDNRPSNLEWISHRDHMKMHCALRKEN